MLIILIMRKENRKLYLNLTEVTSNAQKASPLLSHDLRTPYLKSKINTEPTNKFLLNACVKDQNSARQESRLCKKRIKTFKKKF